MIPTLLEDYKKFEKIMKKVDISSSSIDTSNERFLAPTTLIPLLCYAEKNNINKFYLHKNTEGYVERILNRKETSTTIPYQKLPISSKERQEKELSKQMVDRISRKWGTTFGGSWTLRYIFTELTNNIYDHTSFEEHFASQGYTYAQHYPNKNVLDLCVMDDGLSIPGRLKKEGISFDDECHAIEKAINNISTSPEPHNPRGDGLWSTIRLVVEGNGGNVLIVSGKGLLHIKSIKDYKYKILNNEHLFEGTLISLRLRNTEVEHFYDYIDFYPGKKYEYKGDLE